MKEVILKKTEKCKFCDEKININEKTFMVRIGNSMYYMHHKCADNYNELYREGGILSELSEIPYSVRKELKRSLSILDKDSDNKTLKDLYLESKGIIQLYNYEVKKNVKKATE